MACGCKGKNPQWGVVLPTGKMVYVGSQQTCDAVAKRYPGAVVEAIVK